MCNKGGRDTEKGLFSEEGGYKTILSNKTFQKPCQICNGEITKKLIWVVKFTFVLSVNQLKIVLLKILSIKKPLY